MIKLYHGSNVRIDQIDLSFSKNGKDFGKGFYLNEKRQQAMDMAVRTSKRQMTGKPIVNSYLFDETILTRPSDLKIKVFDDYSKEWAEFVLMNRNNSTDKQAHPYDIVVGPIADDTVGVQIRRFTMGYISIDALIEELKFNGSHAIQYFFGTERAVKLLTATDDE